MIALTKKEKIDLLLIAGDLFHRQPLLRQLREVNYLFSEISETQVVWMAGNHDYLREDSAYRKVQWAENVHGFFSQKPEVFILEKIHTWIYGLSYENREITSGFMMGFTPMEKRDITFCWRTGEMRSTFLSTRILPGNLIMWLWDISINLRF